MPEPRKTSRRDFLKGRATVAAVEDLLDRVPGETPPVKPLSQSASERERATYLVQISRRAMATDFQIYLNAQHDDDAAEAAVEALDLVDLLEDQMTVYREHSEISEINRRAFAEAVVVEPLLFELLCHAANLSRETSGAFDITSGPLSKLWGFHRRQGRFPQQHEIEEVLNRVGSQHLELDRSGWTIRFLHEGVEINLGAIGKGYALDRCSELLREADVNDFLMHGGQSSIVAFGSRAGIAEEQSGWKVAVRHPLKPDIRVAELRLRNQALGTSGSGTQFFHHRGQRYGHVLDPRTGWPAQGVLSATVLAASAADADALATAFYVTGIDGAAAYCRDHPGISALLICPTQRSGGISLHVLGMDDETLNTTLPVDKVSE